MRIPSLEEVEGRKTDNVFNAVRERLETGNYKRYDDWIERLLDAGHTPTDIASALFELTRSDENTQGEEIVEDREPFSEERPKKKNKGKEVRSPYRERGSGTRQETLLLPRPLAGSKPKSAKQKPRLHRVRPRSVVSRCPRSRADPSKPTFQVAFEAQPDLIIDVPHSEERSPFLTVSQNGSSQRAALRLLR